jgi:hypothetical protein
LFICEEVCNVLVRLFFVFYMADVIEGTQREFWRAPSVLEAAEPGVAAELHPLAEACVRCGSEFMIGAKFCHACGSNRPINAPPRMNAGLEVDGLASLRRRSAAWAHIGASRVAASWNRVSFPSWLRYLHFHEIKHWVGLPTASLIAFITGLGCIVGVVGVSFFYKASNLAEFQAIQLWRIEWLLAATAAFVAGILLKKPEDQ